MCVNLIYLYLNNTKGAPDSCYYIQLMERTRLLCEEKSFAFSSALCSFER